MYYIVHYKQWYYKTECNIKSKVISMRIILRNYQNKFLFIHMYSSLTNSLKTEDVEITQVLLRQIHKMSIFLTIDHRKKSMALLHHDLLYVSMIPRQNSLLCKLSFLVTKFLEMAKVSALDQKSGLSRERQVYEIQLSNRR